MANKEDIEITLKGKFENGKLLVDTTKKLDGNIKDIGKSSKETKKHVSSFEKGLKKLATIVGIGFLANQFKNLFKSSLKAAGAMEQVDIALTTMLGSAKKAAELQKDLIKFAKKTPFEIEGIFSTTKQLLAYGIAQEDIIKTMSTLGNIASGIGVDMQRLALVFGQVRSTGRLLGQDLNQFTQAGVPLLAELAKLLGKTEAEVLKLKESGAISFDLVKQALENMTSEGGRFFNLMENQSKTLLGTVSNMQDGFYEVKVALGNVLLPTAKKFVNFMIPSLEKLAKTIKENSKQIEGFVDALVATFYPVKTFILGIKTILSQPILKWLALVTTAIYGVRLALLALIKNPVIVFISSIVMALGWVIESFNSFSNSIKIALLESLKVFKDFQLNIFAIVDEILAKFATLSKVPGFGWTQDLSNSFNKATNKIINDVDRLNERLAGLKGKAFDVPRVKIGTEMQGPAKNDDSVDELDKIREKNEEKFEIQQSQNELEIEQLLGHKANIENVESGSQSKIDANKKKSREDLQKAEAKSIEKRFKHKAKMDTYEYKAAVNVTGQLVQLQNSKNKEMAAIGKAAAIFQITNETAKGAISAYASLAPIPFVGPVLGAAASATIIAYGVERLGEVKANSFAVGTSNIPEDQMANVHKGEIIVPESFAEAIRSGKLALSGKATETENISDFDSSSNITNININFDGAQFVGKFDDEQIEEIGERLGQLISEDITPPLPT